jgi:hypothetical protein
VAGCLAPGQSFCQNDKIESQ